MTHWWSDSLKNEVKNKKKLWREHISERTTESYDRYKEQRKAVKRLIREAKKEDWEKFGKILEENKTENIKLFYKSLKEIRQKSKNTINFIKSKDGKLITNREEIVERWKEYFEELLAADVANETEDVRRLNREVGADSGITMAELLLALRSLKVGNAAGCDNISPEMVKYLGERGRNKLPPTPSSHINC